MEATLPAQNAPRLAAERAIAALGGTVQAARVLNVPEHRHQTVQSWLKTRVPAEWCPQIERATAGAVRCEDLRPDVAWDVLRGQAIELVVQEN